MFALKSRTFIAT